MLHALVLIMLIHLSQHHLWSTLLHHLVALQVLQPQSLVTCIRPSDQSSPSSSSRSRVSSPLVRTASAPTNNVTTLSPDAQFLLDFVTPASYRMRRYSFQFSKSFLRQERARVERDLIKRGVIPGEYDTDSD